MCSRRDMIAVECLSIPQLSYRDVNTYISNKLSRINLCIFWFNFSSSLLKIHGPKNTKKDSNYLCGMVHAFELRFHANRVGEAD